MTETYFVLRHPLTELEPVPILIFPEQHETKEESIVRKDPASLPSSKVKRKKATQPGYDPFKLVPCSRFSKDVPVSAC